MTTIALIGEYNPQLTSHLATSLAIEHSNQQLNSNVQSKWINSQDIDKNLFKSYQAIWITPGGPHKDIDKTLWAIQYARKNNIPCLGTCGGFQHIILKYARNV